MKISLSWLKQYVDIDIAPQELCDRMTMAGFEIEEMQDLSQSMRNVVVGRIEKLEKHPDADRLKICQVNVGDRTVQIVTGADNVFAGALVPAALDGSLLPTGQEIRSGKLRGVVSDGMLCSGEELMLTEEEYPGAGVYGILILKPDCVIGADMKEVLGRNDCIIDFKVTPNRPDCLCALGIAREISVMLKKPFNKPVVSGANKGGEIESFAKVEVRDQELCPRYTARGVRNVKIEPSPKWMQERLLAAGMRPISNIVDITNYVMLETGQPMHAFDMRDVTNRQIVVRRAQEKEKLVTLDKKEHELNSSMLVIADEARAVGLAGIMGGLNSEIKLDTSEILFESAKFKRDSVRRTARALGIRTEASSRYEKGIDIDNVEYAVNRAIDLVKELNAGEVIEGAIDISVPFEKTRSLTVCPKSINALLGVEVGTEEMISILEALGIPAQQDGDTLKLTIPSFREDIEHEADIAEEIIRIYGYEHITATPLRGEIVLGRRPESMLRDEKIKSRLVMNGYREIVTYSFVSPKVYDMLRLPADDCRRRAVPIINSLGEDYSLMRTQLYHSMLSVMATNVSRSVESARLFEISMLHFPKEMPIVNQPEEKAHICLGAYGDIDFFGLKSAVEGIMETLNVSAEYRPSNQPFMHPGRQAEIIVQGKKIGHIGEIHPLVLESYSIDKPAVCAQFCLDDIIPSNKTIVYRPLSKYPSVQRDLAVVVEEQTAAGELIKAIQGAGGNNLKSVELFDIYRSPLLGADKKSMAFSLIFRSEERTLTVEEVAKAFDKIVRALEYKFGAKLR